MSDKRAVGYDASLRVLCPCEDADQTCVQCGDGKRIEELMSLQLDVRMTTGMAERDGLFLIAA